MTANRWAADYLRARFPDFVLGEESAQAFDAFEDPFLEIFFLHHSGSFRKCLDLTLTALATAPEGVPPSVVAELAETAEHCDANLTYSADHLAALRQEAERDPENGEAHANLGLALSRLGDEEGAVGAYQRALMSPDRMCFAWHRDCLNNIGWYHYLHGIHEEALLWFDRACWLKPTPREEEEPLEEAEPEAPVPYRLALENILLTLAKMGRLQDATAKLQEYHRHFGRLPEYERRALEKLGLQADIIYLRSR